MMWRDKTAGRVSAATATGLERARTSKRVAYVHRHTWPRLPTDEHPPLCCCFCASALLVLVRRGRHPTMLRAQCMPSAKPANSCACHCILALRSAVPDTHRTAAVTALPLKATVPLLCCCPPVPWRIRMS